MKKLINNSLFFAGKKKGKIISSNIFDNIKLSELDFNKRFINSIKSKYDLINLTDLLNTDYADIVDLPDCGKKTLQVVRKNILEKFGKKENTDISSQNDNLQNFPFFKNAKFILSGNLEVIMNLNLNELNFEISFIKYLEQFTDLINVRDLLNKPPNYFKRKANYRKTAVRKAKQLLTKLLTGKIPIPPANIKFIFNRLNKKSDIEIYSANKVLLKSDIHELDFGMRFNMILMNFRHLKTLRDLLSTSPNAFLMIRNCGIRSIEIAQDSIIEMFLGKQGFELSNDKKIDENISKNLMKIIKNERDVDIFLRFHNYNDPRKITLTLMAAHYGLSRERIRQIIETNLKKVLRRLFIFDELVKELKSYGYIYSIESFINFLINNNLWGKRNYKFAERLISEFINTRFDISVKGNFVFTMNIDSLNPAINTIKKLISKRIKDLQEGIETEEMIAFLKDQLESAGQYDMDKLLNTDVFNFISYENNKFHIVDNKIYNEMMFQIFFGKYQTDVIYWSMKLISEPVHFSQLTEFVRKNNSNHKEITESSIHSVLMKKELFILAGYGKFALKDSQIEEYRFAIDAIVLLLKEKGALPEKEIIEHLIKKYSSGNLKLTIKNNINKRLIKKGKDLVDIK